MLKLEALEVDTHVAGIEPSGPVKVLYVKAAGPEAVDITYELMTGQAQGRPRAKVSHKAQMLEVIRGKRG